MPILGLDTPYFVRHRWRPWKDKQGHYQFEHEVSFMRDPDEQAALEAVDTVTTNEVVISRMDLLRLCDLAAPAVGDSWEDDDFDFVERMESLLTNQPDPTYPPVSGGALDMDADETACGALCQEHNDRMWAKLGPVDDVELPF